MGPTIVMVSEIVDVRPAHVDAMARMLTPKSGERSEWTRNSPEDFRYLATYFSRSADLLVRVPSPQQHGRYERVSLVCQVQAERRARAGGSVCQTWACDPREVAMVPRFARPVVLTAFALSATAGLRISPGWPGSSAAYRKDR